MMKILKPSFIILFFVVVNITSAQVSYSITNFFRYGSGERTLATLHNDFKYFENLSDVRINFPFNITVGARLLFDDPPEIGIPFSGLKRRFIEYSAGDFYIRAGNFSELYGRGLALNLFDSRGLGYDTWMDGIKTRFQNDFISLSAVAGILAFEDSVEIKRKEDYKIFGGNFEIKPVHFLKLGFTYLYSKGEFDLQPAKKEINVNLPSIYISANSDNFSFLFDYAYKATENLSDNIRSNGSGIYSSLSFTQPGFGITFDYKNYRFDERDPFERNDITRTSRMLPFQNAPIVMKEHSYTLLTRAIHEVDFNDELGIQVEVFYLPNDNTSINFNASLASRHSYYKFDQSRLTFARQGPIEFLPGFDEQYSPYYEIFAEVEHFIDENSSVIAAAAFRAKTFYDEFFDGNNNHKISSIIFPFQYKRTFGNIYSMEFDYQFEAVNDNYNTSQQKYNNHFFSLINIINTRLNVTLRYEFTTNRFEVSGRKDWFTAEVGYRIGQNHTAVASYGREKGGQICSNGVCRYIQPFQGFRFSLLSNF